MHVPPLPQLTTGKRAPTDCSAVPVKCVQGPFNGPIGVDDKRAQVRRHQTCSRR